MAIRREFGNAENDRGVWHDWKEDTDLTKRRGDKAVVAALIRGIPPAVEDQIKRRHKSDTITLRQKTGSRFTETEIALERERRIMRDRAAFALLGLRNYEVFVGDAEAAATYNEILKKTVEPESNLMLPEDVSDNERLRVHVMAEDSAFARWICSVVDGTEREEREIEDSLAGN